jgi:hypothetical protein
MKIRPVGLELFMRDDGRTDITSGIAAFRNFAKAPQNRSLSIMLLKPQVVASVRTTCDGSETLTVRKNGSNTATAQLCWRELGGRAGK